MSTYVILFFALVCFACSAGQAQTMTVEEYEPKSTLVVSEHPVRRAKYPFVDVHTHYDATMPREKLDQLVSELDRINLRVAVNLSGGSGARLEAGVKNMKGAYPNRFVLFANLSYEGIDDPDYGRKAATRLEQDVRNGAQGSQTSHFQSTSALSGTASAQEANTFFQKQDWANAAKAYQALTEREPGNGQAWFRLGYALNALGQYDRAIKAFHRSVEIGGQPIAMYRLAGAYARQGEREKAFEWLGRAMQAGFDQPEQLKANQDLTSLRDDARFTQFIAQAERNARPCEQTPYRQFDFWIGEWRVFAGGQQAGANSVRRILGGCVIFENWTGANGGSGKSFNFYHAPNGKWRQLWVDDKGEALEFTGEFKDGALSYQAESLATNGNKLLHRMTFTRLSADRVRQLWEQSRDGGKTWVVAFDGDYQRKE